MTLLARTPLSTRAVPFTPKMAVPFTPKTDMWSSWQRPDESPAFAQMVTCMPVFFPNKLQAADTAQTSEPEKHGYCRGRTRTKDMTVRLPSRTPSPSGWSICHSEVSTTQEGSIVGTISSSDLTDHYEDLNEFQDLPMKDLPVKNTFVHLPVKDPDLQGDKLIKLSRSSSAPNILLTCQFVVLTMMELHEVGRCSPCAYLYGKADGCRRGSECTFCHACPRDELRNRKKQRTKAIRAKRAALKAEEQVDSDLPMLRGDSFADE